MAKPEAKTPSTAPRIDDYAMPEPPDLQRLVEQYGGYDNIPPKAWGFYDRQLEMTREWLHAHHGPTRNERLGRKREFDAKYWRVIADYAHGLTRVIAE